MEKILIEKNVGICSGLAANYWESTKFSYKPARSLRSWAANNLSVPKSRTTTDGDRPFAYACPKLWNQLPQHIKLSETLELFKSIGLLKHIFIKLLLTFEILSILNYFSSMFISYFWIL